MKKLLLFILFVSAFRTLNAQVDTMYVELNTSIKGYPINDILKVTFDIGTEIENSDLLNNLSLASFVLSQNYPNPFNPSTKLSYRIPKAGEVKVNIYDVNGQLIRELLSAMQDAGDHIVYWDSKTTNGEHANSGIYFCQVQYDNSVLTKKMILIK